MNPVIAGVLWALVFVVIEAVQFVYFGGLFQHVNSFLFGFLVFGIIVILFTGGALLTAAEQLTKAFRQPATLIGLNMTATLAWVSYLTSVELIEPAVVYTISAGVMPITSWLFQQKSQAITSRSFVYREFWGPALLALSVLYLAFVTISGRSGFVQSGGATAVIGVLLAIADGVFFTWMLVYCKKLDDSGVGPGLVFGLRFPLYVLVAGGLSVTYLDDTTLIGVNELALVILLGLLLTVPHLFALQKAVGKISTAHISALTTLGPFIIFVLQMVEGRVQYSSATLVGLFIYFAGSMLSLSRVSYDS